MNYRKSNNNGLLVPEITLGLWHNFGTQASYDNMVQMIRTAFDLGITSFDLANNYGPLPGSAEENFGTILKNDFAQYRDHILITTKAGHDMWTGPYGEWGTRKHIMASINQSLKRLQVEYVDIFYSHRPDPNTPLEETMQALVDIVQSGKALYIGLSKYSKEEFEQAYQILRQLGRTPIVYQGKYSLLEQSANADIVPSVHEHGCGFAAFSPLAQGMLTNKYLHGIPANSRAAGESPFLNAQHISEQMEVITQLNDLALQRGQTLAQMALSWILHDHRMTTAVIGASRPEQITDCAQATQNTHFSPEELEQINRILTPKA